MRRHRGFLFGRYGRTDGDMDGKFGGAGGNGFRLFDTEEKDRLREVRRPSDFQWTPVSSQS